MAKKLSLTARNQLVKFQVVRISDPSQKVREIELALLMVCRKETKENDGIPNRILIHPANGVLTESDIKQMLLKKLEVGLTIEVNGQRVTMMSGRQLKEVEIAERLGTMGFRKPDEPAAAKQTPTMVAPATS